MAGAKSSSHVPKFGNWDTDDVPYTICFENASELRAAGITFDPNDPDTYPPEVFAPPPAAANHKSTPADRRQHHGQAATHDGGKHQQRRPREGGAIASSGSEKLNSERSSSDYALLKERKQSRRKKSSENGVEGIGRLPPAVGGHGGNPNPKVRRSIEGEMMASVPKFGSWDARDPRSGDGYTAVYNKVKIEKQNAASNPQAVPPLMNQTKQPVAHTTTTTQGWTSLASKICCCLCPK